MKINHETLEQAGISDTRIDSLIAGASQTWNAICQLDNCNKDLIASNFPEMFAVAQAYADGQNDLYPDFKINDFREV